MSGPQADAARPAINPELRELPRPEPVPDWAAYDRERELCLAADSRKRANYERYVASRRRGETTDYLPIKLDIETISRCNFRCTMCQVSEWTKGQRARDMTVEEFKGLIDKQYGLVEIKLQGMGEPLMQRDAYFEMIRYARDRHIWVRTVSNASLLHLNDNHRKIIDSDVSELQISVDGADKQTFEAIRRGSVFERVTENIKMLNAYCREQGVIRTKMWTVVQKANQQQVHDLVCLANELGFTTMVFSLNLTDWGQEEWKRRNDAVTVEDSFPLDLAWQLVEEGKELGVQVAFWNVTSKYRTKAPEGLCPWPFERVFISSDMRIVPCCIIGNPEVSDLGHAADLSAAWNGPVMREFRRMHLNGRIPGICRNCYAMADAGDDD